MYTHYWQSSGFTDDQWRRITRLTDRLLANLPEHSESAGGYHADEPLRIDGPLANDFLTVIESVQGEDAIRFNGAEPLNLEAFDLSRGPAEFEFCKTSRKPYDLVVCGVLLVAKAVQPSLSIESDGGAVEWRPAYEWVRSVVGDEVDIPDPESFLEKPAPLDTRSDSDDPLAHEVLEVVRQGGSANWARLMTAFRDLMPHLGDRTRGTDERNEDGLSKLLTHAMLEHAGLLAPEGSIGEHYHDWYDVCTRRAEEGGVTDDDPLTPRDYRDALFVQSASNLSGVVHSFVRTVNRIAGRAPDDDSPMTPEQEAVVSGHPVVGMYLAQMDHLSGAQRSLGRHALHYAVDLNYLGAFHPEDAHPGPR